MADYTEILRSLREDCDLTQAQVAAALGTTQQVYARYEKGVNELVIQQDEDYITQIEIPVQDPCSDGSSPRSHRTT